MEFLSSLSSARSRVIFRSTSVYSKLIKESTHPDALGSGIRRSLVFERLFRPLLKGRSLSSHTKKLLNFEVERLSLLDIPRLYAGLDKTDIHLENRDSVPRYIVQTDQRFVEIALGIEQDSFVGVVSRGVF